VNALLIIAGVNAAMAGCGLLFGGYLMLTAPSEAETVEMQKHYREAREKSWMRAILFSFNYSAQTRVGGLRTVINHWPQRPQARRMIYWGTMCLTVATAIGFRFGVFNS
jgi:hypothetical protein